MNHKHPLLNLVIGDPISHSLSPRLHSAGYKALSIEEQFTFSSARVHPSKLESAIEGVRALGIRGVSVTIPHKTEVLAFLDEIDPLAEKARAVNTVVNTDGVLVGYNTDCAGITEPLKNIRSLTDAKVALIGAGGAARAAIAALTASGALITVLNRTESKARTLAREFNADHSNLGDADALGQADIILNTTPLGMAENQSLPISPEHLHEGQVVFDAVYTPYWTPLLIKAKQAGARCVHGLDMFVAQGVAQFELYTGREAPESEMKAAVLQELGLNATSNDEQREGSNE